MIDANTRIETDVDLAAVMDAADPIALRAALWIQTRSDELAEMPVHRPGNLSTHIVPPLQLVSEQDVNDVRAEAVALMRSIEAGTVVPRRPSRGEIPQVIEMLTGDMPEASTHDFWCEEFPIGELTRRPDPIDEPSLRDTLPDLNVVVIGSGMGGISAAVMLQAAGIPFTILEKNPGLGGTWYANTYPGLRVDLPSRAYSFTFEPDYPWRHYFAPQREILDYLERTVDKRGIGEHIVYGTEVTSLTWDADEQRWRIVTKSSDGATREVTANFVISAVGLFSRPRRPDIDGLDTFAGVTMYTSDWDHSVDVEGRRIGVVGTGSSGIQIVRAMADAGSHLTVFQRTASWINNLPRYTSSIPDEELWLLTNFPCYVNCVRVMQIHSIGDAKARDGIHDVDPEWDDPDTVSEVNASVRRTMCEYINTQLEGRPDLIEKVTPSYPPMSKRVPQDNGWYAALLEDHVELETRPIRRIVPTGVELESGRIIELDVLVLATGYRANDFLWPMEITGVDGLKLSERWEKDGPRAYLGIMINGFPNLFCVYGPNTNPTSGTPCMWGELQARFAVETIGALGRAGCRSIDVKPEVFDEYNRRLDEALSNKIWLDPRQKSYYTNEHGRVVTNAPWKARQYWQWTRRPDLDEYILR